MTYPLSEGQTFAPAAAAVLSDLGTRQRRIAAIHALAVFYTEHPDVTMPSFVMAVHGTNPWEGDEIDRVNAVLDFARATGAEVTETWGEVKARLYLSVQDGMNVRIVHSAHIDSRPANRYVH